jgi:cyclase
MTPARWILIAVIVTAGAIVGATQPGTPPRPPGTTYKGQAFTFNKIQDGIYHAVGTGSLVVMSNAAIVETDREVLVVDSHVTPGGAWALREELKAITPKPIRFVVNSHYHFDHSHGNQVYGPDVEIIGHDYTRQMIVAGKSIDSRAHDWFVGRLPEQIAALEERLKKSTDSEERARLEAQLAVQRNHITGTKAVVPTPPTVTLSDSLTLHRGGREIRLLFLGRGHTAGDVIVYLPKERLIATGDLIVEGLSYMGDAHFTDWVQTLERVKQLDFDTTLPGHGQAFKGKAKFDHFQAYLREFWSQAQKFHKAGTSADEAAKIVDMRSQAVNYPSIRTVGIIPPHGMLRAYELLNQSR